MGMSPAVFAARVERLEALERASPSAYRAYAIGWALFGYGAIGVTALLSLAVLAILVTIAVVKPNAATVKLALFVGLPAGWLVWNVIKALHVRFDAPDGLRLSRSDAPELWNEIDRVREAVGAPALHGIILTGQLNAAMAQTPRVGALGWYRNDLILGLPLLRSLGEDEARAVVAHEFGHLAGLHGRLSAWIYRIRLAWARMHAQSEQRSDGPKLLRWFLAWYAPRLAAATFVLARGHERAADRAAVAVTGPDALARALARVEVLARAADQSFWRNLDRSALRQQPLPVSCLSPMQAVLDAPPEARRWLREALTVRTGYTDTHPCLDERLRDSNAGIAGPLRGANLPPRPGRSAARAWLAQQESKLATSLDAAWREAVAPRWQSRVADGAQMMQQRDRLLSVAQPTVQQRWELAQVIQQLDGDAAAQPQLEQIIAADRTHAAAAYQLGRILLDAEDARGEILLRHTMRIDPAARIPVAVVMSAWHERHGRQAEALDWEVQAYDRSQEEQAARTERAAMPDRRRLREPKLDLAELANLRSAVESENDVGEAYVVAVEAKHLSERRWLVVAIRTRVPWWKPRGEETDTRLAQAISSRIGVDGDVTVVVRSGKTAGIAKAVAKRAGEPFYRRN